MTIRVSTLDTNHFKKWKVIYSANPDFVHLSEFAADFKFVSYSG